MSDQRVELQSAYILHARPYRDTSLLVDVLTPDYGRVCLIAKGARKAASKGKSNQRSFLQPFISLQLSWQGKSSLKTLIGAEPIENYHTSLAGHRLYSALYVNELLLYVLPQENPADDLYDVYHMLLQHLCDENFELEPCLRQFEFQLLDELGYGINFYAEANNGNDFEPTKEYVYVLNHGFVETHAAAHNSMSFRGEDIINIQQSVFETANTCRAAKIITRLALKPLLKGKELKSRELFL